MRRLALALGLLLSSCSQYALAQLITTPASVNGTVKGYTLSNTSPTQVLSAGQRNLIAVDNESTSATVACAFGGTTPATNTAGSFTINPGQTRTWNSWPVPTDVMICTCTAASCPVTVEAQ